MVVVVVVVVIVMAIVEFLVVVMVMVDGHGDSKSDGNCHDDGRDEVGDGDRYVNDGDGDADGVGKRYARGPCWFAVSSQS
jgi:hypothetical protein